MATRKATPRMSPSLPSGKWMAIGLATLAASTAVIVAVGYNALDSDSSQDTRSGGPAANVSTNANQERRLSPTGNQGFRDFDPDLLYPNVAETASSERKLSPTGNQGFRDFDPDLLYPNVAAGVSSERKLSPTGRQGFRDFDPEILYPSQ